MAQTSRSSPAIGGAVPTQSYNVHHFGRLHKVMEMSLARTLAAKHKSTARKMRRQFKSVVETEHGSRVCLNPNPPKDTDGRREDSGRGWVRELQGRWPGVLG